MLTVEGTENLGYGETLAVTTHLLSSILEHVCVIQKDHNVPCKDVSVTEILSNTFFSGGSVNTSEVLFDIVPSRGLCMEGVWILIE